MLERIKKKYTSPKIKATGKVWYVWFRFLDDETDKMKLFIKKGENANNTNLPKSGKTTNFGLTSPFFIDPFIGW